MPRHRRALLPALLLLPLLALAGPAPAAAEGHEAPGNPPTFAALGTGNGHTCAILADARVKCWGNGSLGQLGTANGVVGDRPGDMGTDLPATDLGTGRVPVALTGGGSQSCALTDDGEVLCWGLNAQGQLGLGDTANRGDQDGEMGDALPAVDLGAGRTATAVSSGGHTCAVLDTGAVKCWGPGTAGALGQGDTATRGDQPGEMGDALPAVPLGNGRTAVTVAAAGGHSCALLDDGTVKCWGSGLLGRLGYGNTAHRGDQPGEMGDALPTVDLGAGRTAVAVSTGGSHTCAILDTGAVKCWGNNNAGQLGLGDKVTRGDDPGEMGDALPAVPLGAGRTAVGITMAFNHTCALLDDGTVKCWGGNFEGQLGQGDTVARGDDAGELGDGLAPVALGTGRTATAISVGTNFSCALLDDATVKCWGNAGVGQTGQETDQNRGEAAGEMGDALPITDLGGPVGPSPDLSVALAVDQSSVPEGTDIDYHATVTNSGSVPLTGVTLSSAVAPGCDGPLADLAVGQQVVVDCSRPTTRADVGVVTASVTVDSNQTPAKVSGEVQTFVERHQPDARIRRGRGALAGDDVYNVNGNGQARSGSVPNRGTVRFTVSVQNDGTVQDDFRLSGPGSTNRFTVTYRIGATNVTAGVVAGTRVIADVAGGTSRAITVTITARNGAPRGAAITRRLTAHSLVTGSRDVVRMTVTRR